MKTFTVYTVFIHIAQIISLKNMKHKHDYCYIETPNKNNKILRYNHGKKSLKASFTVYIINTILKNLTQRKKLSMNLQARQCFKIFIW